MIAVETIRRAVQAVAPDATIDVLDMALIAVFYPDGSALPIDLRPPYLAAYRKNPNRTRDWSDRDRAVLRAILDCLDAEGE